MDKLAAMQTFVRVAESGSFSAVARELGSTQSAVSKQVAGLENALGTRLLSRTTRALSLTEAGQRYFEQARRLVAEVEEAEGLLRSSEQQLSGWLRVAASVGYGRRVLMPLVQSFLNQHPGVRIDLNLNDGFVDLVEHGIDVAVRVGTLADSSLLARRIGTAHRALMVHRSYLDALPAAAQALREPADLAAHNCIVYTELGTRDHWSFTAGSATAHAAGTKVSLRVQGNLQTNSSEVIRAAVLQGMGICYSPDWLFERELARGEVTVLLPDWPILPLPVHLVSPPARRHAAKVQAFGAHVAKNLVAA